MNGKKRRSRIISVGLLGNLVSGIFFGIGCLIVEQIDGKWFATDENTPAQTNANSKVAARESTPSLNSKVPNNKHLAQQTSD